MISIDLEHFPTARTTTYLNSASIALMPTPAIDRMVEFERSLGIRGTVWFDEEAETNALDEARAEVSSILGADRDEVAILSSASLGISSFAWALKLRSEANIVTTDADFPSVVYPWMRLEDERGTKVRLVRNRQGRINEADVEALVDDNTAVVAISHVEYGTGQRFDLRWLSELAHEHGALLMVDATQSAGLLPIDVHRDRVDALVAGGYKGMLGPFGSAALYVERQLAEELRPAFVGWRTPSIPYELDSTRLSFARGVKKFEFSTMNYAAAAGLAESVKYLRQIGTRNVTEHVLSITEKFIEAIDGNRKISSAALVTPQEESKRASIVAYRFHGRDPSHIVAALINRGVIVSQRFDGVRFSFHVYNKDEDLSKAVSALEQVFA